jgi:hypothetical protein
MTSVSGLIEAPDAQKEPVSNLKLTGQKQIRITLFAIFTN